MTRWEIERRVGLLLGESADSPFFGEPMWLREAVIDAANQCAREADAWYTYFALDVDGSETPITELCMPKEIYKPKVVEILSSAGAVSLLREGKELVTPAYLDRQYPAWKVDPPQGTPTLVAFAFPILYVYPQIDYEKESAITVRGFAVPGRIWNPELDAPHRDDVFPLPEWTLDAVTYKAAQLRCIQTKDWNTLAAIKSEAREAQGMCNRLAGDAYSRLRKEWGA